MMKPLPLQSEDGWTLIEVMIYTGILGLLLAAIFGMLTTSQFTVERQAARSDTNDQIRQAAEGIDREVRSGDLLYDPGLESYPSGDIAACPPATPSCIGGYSIRVYSETNVPTRTMKRCVQYRITSAGELQRRDWDPNWTSPPSPTQVSGWRTLATGLQNRVLGVPAFSRSAINLMSIDFRANARRGTGLISAQVTTVRVQLAVSGRNSQIVANLQQCGPPTPDPSQQTDDGRKVPPY